jgi:hypothetical protein
MSRCSKLKQSPKDGTSAEKLLDERSKYCRVSQVAKLGSISPVSLFCFKSKCCIPLQPVWKSQGITFGPESLLKETSRTSRLRLGESLMEEESREL